jgi:high mobility group protein B1
MYGVKKLLISIVMMVIQCYTLVTICIKLCSHRSEFCCIEIVSRQYIELHRDSARASADRHWETLCLAEENQLNKGKGDPKKPRGKMSSYAFFVQTCREEHKKKHPDASVNFSEFSKKCSERWKTISAKKKRGGEFEDMAKADKARYEREMKTYIPPPKGETKKKFKDPNAPKRPPSAFFLFCSAYCPKIKGEHPGLCIGDVAKKLGGIWNNTAANDKQP